MANNIKGITIEIGGNTTQLNKALSGVNTTLKGTQGQLKEVERLLKLDPTNTELLRQKQVLLKEATGDTAKKLETLREAERQLKNSGVDENSEQFMALQREIIATENAMKGLSNEAQKGAESTKEQADAAEDSVEKNSKLGKVLGTVGTAFAAVAAAAAAAAAAVIKGAVEQYAQYEQLVGGVETLFKDDASGVINYANNAYKSAGLSANEYMETVTAFSASLLQSLGQDTEKAVEYANLAITDMADNANKMGSDMSSIQNAYQGFAKQNYTMLDNLKLGYGGTKEEMERLLQDATLLSGVEYSIDSYADIVAAIHVVQTELGITGTTAKEASTTIQGSIASMKSAWTNLLTGIADEDANVSGLISNFIDSLMTVGDNLLPRIKIAINGVLELIRQMVPQIPPIILDMLPDIMEAANDLLVEIIAILPTLIDGIVAFLPYIIDALMGMLPSILTAVGSILTSVVDLIGDTLPTILLNIIDMLPGLLLAIDELVPKILGAMHGLVEKLLPAIPELITRMIENIPDLIIGSIERMFENVGFILDITTSIINALFDAIPLIVAALAKAIPTIFEKLKTFIKEELPGLAKSLWETIVADFNDIAFELTEGDFFQTIKDAINLWIYETSVKLNRLLAKGGDFFNGVWEKVSEVFKSIVNSLIGGLNKVIAAPINAINDVLEKIRDIKIFGQQPFADLIKTINVPEIPMLARGGTVANGMAIVGEAGPELLTVGNGRTTVTPLTARIDSADLAAISGRQNINIQFTGSLAQLARVLQPAIVSESGRLGASLIGG